VPEIQPLFAVPFGFANYPSPEKLNESLRSLFITREHEGKKYSNPRPLTQRNPQLFESSFDLFKWPDPAIRELRRFCWHHLMHMVGELNGYKEDTLRQILIYSDAWFHVTRRGGFFGLHNHPGIAAGTFLFGAGPFMSASDTAKITIRGRGGHAARPHLAVDPVVIGASLVMALQTVVSRNIDPTQTAIVTAGTFHAGSAANVIPESAVLELSIRSFDAAVRENLQQRITELADAHVRGYGGSVEIDYQRGYPVVVNSAAETEFARQVAEELVGPQRVVAPFGPVTGSEDFAYYLQHRPGCFLRLGNGENCPMLHHPKYDFDDANLTVGAAYWTRLVERFLGQPTA